ncbi:MAG: ABC transporter ATP-binding protein/permease [Clostridia bacterium]|nr:ABC transporter ATP-binding protein/permease [Clostridia bacterium]
MLELRNIKKTYVTGGEKVEALKGINLKFRESEFVSILGQSGCGKTTLLNIIGGLDRYTSGDLIINGKSTKDFKDRDWDSYRNYSVGFIFQSYNLIGHQTVLSNVELALTISGVSKSERRERAIKALEEVGLKDQIHKKPNQLSGGQMQRVAIARALVNNPDIILADEPTGALDTKTSVQVMEILKKISKDKLIVMVTHNSDLAENYSNRIIKILDGKITEDSNPIEEKGKGKVEEKAKYRRTSMKLLTAFRLSLNNLLTKKGRTILTAFAGSIGIIGIALILAISTGVKSYIDKVEEDTLSSYPIEIQDATIDMGSLMSAMMDENGNEHEDMNKIYSTTIMNDIINTISSEVETNNLNELKKYIDNTDNDIKKYSNAIQYGYNLNLNLYNADTSEKIIQVNPSTVLESIGMQQLIDSQNAAMGQIPGASAMSGMSMASRVNIWTEMLDNQELLESQYDLLDGRWPEKYNEVVLIVDENNNISDYTLYTLGLENQDDLRETIKRLQNGEKFEPNIKKEFSFDDFIGLKYKVLLNSDYFSKENGVWIDKSKDAQFIKNKVNNAEEISVVGIIKQNDQTVASSMQGGIGYTKELKEYVIEKSNQAEIVLEQKQNPNVNVFSGLFFPVEINLSKFDMQSLTEEQKMMMANLSAEEISALMNAYSDNSNATYDGNLQRLGAVDINTPSSIRIYPKDFDSKKKIEEGIEEYNQIQKDKGQEDNTITYSDIVGTMISSVSRIIDIISYVLIAFVAISLIVSSIMIAIITYISVLERTKEIGILRAIGTSKKDIRRIFNAETIIEGLIAGLLGIGITVLLTIPINAGIYKVTDVAIKTRVPLGAGIILVLLSIVLTTIAGLIPSKMASKKDPVVALRSE